MTALPGGQGNREKPRWPSSGGRYATTDSPCVEDGTRYSGSEQAVDHLGEENQRDRQHQGGSKAAERARAPRPGVKPPEQVTLSEDRGEREIELLGLRKVVAVHEVVESVEHRLEAFLAGEQQTLLFRDQASVHNA